MKKSSTEKDIRNTLNVLFSMSLEAARQVAIRDL